jgi:hypothetical protein
MADSFPAKNLTIDTSKLSRPSNLCSPSSRFCNIACGATCAQLNVISYCDAARPNPVNSTMWTFTGGPTFQTTSLLNTLASKNISGIFLFTPENLQVPSYRSIIIAAAQSHIIGYYANPAAQVVRSAFHSTFTCVGHMFQLNCFTSAK